MRVVNYNRSEIKPIVSSQLFCLKLSICRVWICDENSNDNYEEELLVFGKYFNTEADLLKFQKTAFYKQALKAALKAE